MHTKLFKLLVAAYIRLRPAYANEGRYFVRVKPGKNCLLTLERQHCNLSPHGDVHMTSHDSSTYSTL